MNKNHIENEASKEVKGKDNKSDIDKEIEEELLRYLDNPEKEQKIEKKKYKTAMFFVMFIIACIYLYKFLGHLI